MEGFDDLLEAKAKELRDLQDKKVLVLQEEIRCRESQLVGVRDQYGQLKDDFEYNLSLLSERDNELGNYDKVISEMNAKLGSYMAEISDIKVELANSLQLLKEEQSAKEELKYAYQARLVHMEGLLEHQSKLKDKEVSDSLAENARVRQQLETQLSELHEDGERKMREWERSFEQELSSITSSHHLKVSELTSRLVESDGRLKQAVTEQEALHQTVSELQSTLEQREAHITQMENAVTSAEWEVNNYISVQLARIKELEQSVMCLEEEGLKRERVSTNKLTLVETRLKEREAVYAATLDQYEQEEKILRKELGSLVGDLEKERCEGKVRVGQSQDMCSDKDNEIKRLNSKVEQLHVENTTLLERKSREEVTQKVEWQQSQQKCYQLKCDLDMRKTEIDKYKADLLLMTKREDSLRTEAAQDMRLLTLRCEAAESRAYGNQEEFVQEVISAKEKALAELKRLKGDAGLQEEELLALRAKLDKAYKVSHDVSTDNRVMDNVPGTSDESSELLTLKEQNERLRVVIKQMSEDMHIISAQRGPVTDRKEDDFTELLRREISALRKQIISEENTESDQADLHEELRRYKSRVAGLEKERDKLLELSNGIRVQLNALRSSAASTKGGEGMPLADITSDLCHQRSSLTSRDNQRSSLDNQRSSLTRIPTYRSNRAPSSSSSMPSVSLIHMSGDTSINDELTELCRMVDEEENRPLDDSLTPIKKYNNIAITGKEMPMVSPPKPGQGKMPVRKVNKPKLKIRNYAKNG